MWVKLCGIRDVETARMADAVGAEAIGLNFYAPSPRSVSVETAREVVAAVGGDVECVGLFVNHPLRAILEAVDNCGLGTVQLHGDETPADIAALQRERPELGIVVAHRFEGDPATLLELEVSLADVGVRPRAILVDARVDGAYGGTGHTLPWDRLAAIHETAFATPLVLAGGLVPENVAEAIRIVRPWGVDTASGVESSKGVKDAELMRAFVTAAKA